MHGSQFGGRQNSDFNSNKNQNTYSLKRLLLLLTIYLSYIWIHKKHERFPKIKYTNRLQP